MYEIFNMKLHIATIIFTINSLTLRVCYSCGSFDYIFLVTLQDILNF